MGTGSVVAGGGGGVLPVIIYQIDVGGRVCDL